LNWGPLRPERSALPGCATPRAAFRVATVPAPIRHEFAVTVVVIDNEGGHVNNVSLIGNLCTDVELKELSAEKKVATFLLAVDRPGEGADFVRVATWDRQAEVCAEYLSKGVRVAVDGRLRSRSWEEEGKRRTVVEVVANRVQFLGSRRADDAPFEPATASS
jgi:single-strand DNA-binding protein